MADSSTQLPNAPYLVPAYEPILSGVDFLNLRQVNLDFMARCFPGTNNATKNIRGYSLICWIYWMYAKQLKLANRETARSDELAAFREKVESLYVWSHQLQGLGGMPGISSTPPKPNTEGKVELSFSAWKRSKANTSLEAAVQYGPSLSDLGGLGLIHQLEPGIYSCNARGAALAEALDMNLRESPSYSFLTDLNALTATEQQARDLFPYWAFEEANSQESEAFSKCLWDASQINETSPAGRRARGVELVLQTLRLAEGALSIDELRRRMALPGDSGEAKLPATLVSHSRIWLLLQLRQLQRMAMETLMGWIETQLLGVKNSATHNALLPDALVNLACNAFLEETGTSPETTVRELLESDPTPWQSVEDYALSVAEEPDNCSPLNLMDQLSDAIRANDDQRLELGLHSMLILAKCSPFLNADETTRDLLNQGGAPRQSLGHWFELIEKFRDRPLQSLVDWMIKNMLVSQHFAVGTRRYDGERIRLRMTLEEDGLETLVTRAWRPAPTPDRLLAMLSLLTGCGFIVEQNDKYVLA